MNIQCMHQPVKADERGEVGSLQVVYGADEESTEDRQTQTDNQTNRHARIHV